MRTSSIPFSERRHKRRAEEYERKCGCAESEEMLARERWEALEPIAYGAFGAGRGGSRCVGGFDAREEPGELVVFRFGVLALLMVQEVV